ncbi:hypothetical protein LP420_28980 [Massilia sp. B-10]|nr:hypothetical protein LP420_28980 [Massilia sp. B-10]
MHSTDVSWRRRFKNRVFALLGQLPDPRLPFRAVDRQPAAGGRSQGPFARRRRRGRLGATVADVAGGAVGQVALRQTLRTRLSRPFQRMPRNAWQLSWPNGSNCGLTASWSGRPTRWSSFPEPMASYYRGLGGRVHTILNGFDQALLAEARDRARPTADGQVLVCHMGMISPGRIPHRLLAALCSFREQDPGRFARLRFEFYGNAGLLQQALQDRYPAASGAFHFLPALAYRDALTRMAEADYLLFSETSSTASLSAAGILPTKLFEYIGTGRPVLADIGLKRPWLKPPARAVRPGQHRGR